MARSKRFCILDKKIDSAVVAANQLGKQAAIDSLEKAGKLIR